MNIILAGHSGVQKRQVANRLKTEFAKQKAISNGSISRYIEYYEVEELITNKRGFLTMANDRRRKEVWRNAFDRTLDKINQEKPDHALIGLHLTFQRESRFFSPVNWIWKGGETGFDVLRQLKPEYFVTLIDDIYCVWNRIAEGSYFRLRELTAWRTMEALMADIAARETVTEPPDNSDDVSKYPYNHSPIVAVKHPPVMLYRYLFEPRKLRIYASFPISRNRDERGQPKSADKANIDNFREILHDNFTVLDPLTIDEKPLEFLLKQVKQANSEANQVDFDWSIRWSIPSDLALLYDDTPIKNLALAEIDEIARPAELGKGKSEIDNNIRYRDFRLIDQADCVAVYRPQYKTGRIAGGVGEEIRYAVDIADKPVFVVHNPKEDGEDLLGALGAELDYVTSIDALLERLKAYEAGGEYMTERDKTKT